MGRRLSGYLGQVTPPSSEGKKLVGIKPPLRRSLFAGAALEDFDIDVHE